MQHTVKRSELIWELDGAAVLNVFIVLHRVGRVTKPLANYNADNFNDDLYYVVVYNNNNNCFTTIIQVSLHSPAPPVTK